jgi:hypothetical protein
MPKFRVYANLPHYCVVEAKDEIEARDLALATGGDGGWEACYDTPTHEGDVYEVELAD